MDSMTIYDVGKAIAEFFKRPGQWSNVHHPVFVGSRGLRSDRDFKRMIQHYRSWVYVAAQRNAITCASIPIRLYVTRRTSGNMTRQLGTKQKDYLYSQADLSPYLKQARDVEEVTEHPFLDLIRNVNPHMNRFDLMEMTFGYLDVTGNSYWHLVYDRLGLPQELWIIPSQNMNVVPDKQKFIAGYIYEAGTSKIPFEAEEIIHFKYASLSNAYYGMSPMQAAAASVNANTYIQEYAEQTFKTMGSLDGAFVAKQVLSETNFNRMKQQLRQEYSGSKGNQLALLSGDLDYKKYGLSPREIGFLQTGKLVKEEILNIYGQTLGMYDIGTNRANSDNAVYLHMKDAIKPRLVRIQEKLNEKLMPRYNDQLFVAFDNPVPEDKDFRLKQIEVRLKNFMTTANEEREADGLPPVDWGDRPLVPFNTIPLGSAPATEDENVSAD